MVPVNRNGCASSQLAIRMTTTSFVKMQPIACHDMGFRLAAEARERQTKTTSPAVRRIPTFMGTVPIFARSYTQHPDGTRSEFSYHGSKQNPTPILDGAAVTGPTPPPSTGNGTSPPTRKRLRRRAVRSESQYAGQGSFYFLAGEKAGNADHGRPEVPMNPVPVKEYYRDFATIICRNPR